MNELLEQIKRAEEAAEAIRADAASQAREIVKNTEEACASSARESRKAVRDAALRMVEEARVCARDEINQLSVRMSAQRELMRGLAETRIPKVCMVMTERIVDHGDR